MTYEEFLKFVPAKCMYETIYEDTEGRPILIISMLAAYGMVNKAQRPWQGLTEEDWDKVGDMPDTFDQGAAWAAARLKAKNDH